MKPASWESRCAAICSILQKKDSAEPLRLVSYVGKQIPLYCTAIGRALLAQKTKDEIRACIRMAHCLYKKHHHGLGGTVPGAGANQKPGICPGTRGMYAL